MKIEVNKIMNPAFLLGTAFNIAYWHRKYHSGTICKGVSNPQTSNALSGCVQARIWCLVQKKHGNYRFSSNNRVTPLVSGDKILEQGNDSTAGHSTLRPWDYGSLILKPVREMEVPRRLIPASISQESIKRFLPDKSSIIAVERRSDKREKMLIRNY